MSVIFGGGKKTGENPEINLQSKDQNQQKLSEVSRTDCYFCVKQATLNQRGCTDFFLQPCSSH